MADLYNIIQNLTPTAQEVLESELLAKQILEAKFPDLDLREGLGLRDLTIRPVAFALSLLKKSIDYEREARVLGNATDATDTAIVDDILSNFFSSRNLGESSIISARLFFATRKSVSIPSNAYFSTDGELKFYPSDTLTFPSSAMSYDSERGEWYIDVMLTSEGKSVDYNLGQGSLLYFSTFDPYFLHAEINYLAQAASSPETNTQFIERTRSGISTRNLINQPSIEYAIKTLFTAISRMKVVGMGDPGMIRDLVRAYIEPEAQRFLTSLTQSSGVATATLASHGFEVGQLVQIVGASPSVYNGVVEVTSTTTNTFTYSVNSSAGTVSTLPYAQSYTPPTLLHSGGKVDVYCDDSLTESLIQVTTDGSGNATLSGPVLRVSRSEISGGENDDTIPFSSVLTTSSVTFNSGTKTFTAVTAAAHGLITGNTVGVKNLTQKIAIASIYCTNTTVTVSTAGHSLTAGSTVRISGVTPDAYNGTFTVKEVSGNLFTYELPYNILSNGAGTMYVENPGVEGEFSVTYLSTTSFSVQISQLWATGTITYSSIEFRKFNKVSVSNPYLIQRKVTSAVGTGFEVTITSPSHGFSIGRLIKIAGASPTSLNGEWRVLSVPTSDTLVIEVTSLFSGTATGTITLSGVAPWNDVGFSSRQKTTLSFGAGFPNGTASLNITSFGRVTDVQEYLESNTQVVCADYLARGFDVCLLDINVVVYNEIAPTTGLVRSVTDTVLKALQPGEVLVTSDIISALKAAGVNNLKVPMEITATVYTKDLMTPKQFTVTDYVDEKNETMVFLTGVITTEAVFI